jgi:hypothetical protein
MKKKTLWFGSFYSLLFQFRNRKSMFAVLHSDIYSFKSGPLHLNGQPYCKKGSRSAKVKDGIINLILRNYRIDEYNQLLRSVLFSTMYNFIIIHCIYKVMYVYNV